VYQDPITGRILYQSQSVGNLTNQSYADQQMLDQIMGTNVSSQNINQQVKQLEDYMDLLESQGADTTYYEGERQRLLGLGQQKVDPNNPLLSYINSGLNENVMNRTTEDTVNAQLKAMEDAQARRGIGVLGSPMTDQLRASLGLSTAAARNKNKMDAQDQAFKNRMGLMSALKASQQQDYGQDMGRTATGLTMGDWENQRKIAEISQKNTNKQYEDMLDAKKSGDIWGAVGQIGGSIDWGSIF
jgi:hypothetical protein